MSFENSKLSHEIKVSSTQDIWQKPPQEALHSRGQRIVKEEEVMRGKPTIS